MIEMIVRIAEQNIRTVIVRQGSSVLIRERTGTSSVAGALIIPGPISSVGQIAICTVDLNKLLNSNLENSPVI